MADEYPLTLRQIDDSALARLPAGAFVLLGRFAFGAATPMHPPPLNGASVEYREIAGELRKLARNSRFPGSRRDLLQLAARLDRKAEHFDSKEPPILPGG